MKGGICLRILGPCSMEVETRNQARPPQAPGFAFPRCDVVPVALTNRRKSRSQTSSKMDG